MKTFIIVALSLALLGFSAAQNLRGQGADAIPDGLYTLTDAATGLNLAVKDGSLDESATITLAKPNDSNAQKFLIKRSGQTIHYIMNVNSALYLTQSAQGAVQTTLAYASQQEFIVVKSPQGNFVLVHKADNTALQSTREGERVAFGPTTSTQGFRITLTKVNEEETSGNVDNYVIESAIKFTDNKLQNGVYTLMMADSDDSFHADGNKNVLIQQNLDDSLKEQHFRFEAREGAYRITSISTGKVLSVEGKEKGKAIKLANAADGHKRQLWKVQERDTGYWSIRNLETDKAITIAKVNGGEATQQPYVGARHQTFSINPVQA